MQTKEQLEEQLKTLQSTWSRVDVKEALIKTHHSLGLLHRMHDEFSESEPHYQAALDLSKERFGVKHLETASRRNFLAGLYFACGKYKEAEILLEESLRDYQELLGENDPVTAIALYAVALVKHRVYVASLKSEQPLDDNEIAPIGPWDDYFSRSVRIFPVDLTQLSMLDSHELSLAIFQLSREAFQEARFKEAEELFRHSFLIELEDIWPQHPLIGDTYSLLAELCRGRGLLLQSEQLYKRTLVIKEKLYGADDLHLAPTYKSLATLLHSTGRSTEAEPFIKRACDIYRASSAFPPLLGNSLRLYAEILKSTGRSAEASVLSRQADEIFSAHGPR